MRWLILLILLVGCGQEGSDSNNPNDAGGTVGGFPIQATVEGENNVVNINVTDSGDGQINDDQSDNNIQDLDSGCGGSCDNDDQALCISGVGLTADEIADCPEAEELAPDITIDQRIECARCCVPSQRGEFSESSCVSLAEGEGNVNGDCPGEYLVFAGCTLDLSGRTLLEDLLK